MKSSMAFTFFLLLSTYPCSAQEQPVLCSDGSGGFQSEFRTGVSVRVSASKNGELSARKCDAELTWSGHRLEVATDASQVDLDGFGIDIGVGIPVAAFQVKRAETDCCGEYQMYNLSKPPQLLRTIRGSGSFSAADTDLDGQVEVWTDDAAAIRGFEGLNLAEFDFAPVVVLRFSRNSLLDVSAEFRESYDERITKLRAELNPDVLRDFKNNTAPSRSGPASAEESHRLRVVKAGVLEIVWSYLYSGREQQAWQSLAEMWPSNDVDRIRESILQTYAHGIRAQLDGVAPASSKRKKHATIFDAVGHSAGEKSEVSPPEPILLTRPDTAPPKAETALTLVIDAAGKVRSVEAMGKSRVDPALIQAAKGWKFIPAVKGGRAVASRSRLSVFSRQ